MIALLVIAAVAPFAQTLLYGFVLDDTSIIRGNPLVHSWAGVLSAWAHPFWSENGPSRSGLYRPLLIAIFTVIWNVGHKFAIWFHLFAIAAHVCATCLVVAAAATRGGAVAGVRRCALGLPCIPYMSKP